MLKLLSEHCGTLRFPGVTKLQYSISRIYSIYGRKRKQAAYGTPGLQIHCCLSFLLFFNFLYIFTVVLLLYNVVLVSALQPSESALCIQSISPYPLPLEPPSHPPYPTPLGGHKAPSWSPCAVPFCPKCETDSTTETKFNVTEDYGNASWEDLFRCQRPGGIFMECFTARVPNSRAADRYQSATGLHSRRWAAGEPARRCLHYGRNHHSQYRLNHRHLPPPVRGKIVFQETGPWCQKGWGPLPYSA